MEGAWGIILGASSGMGLATAKKMAESGMNLILIHRDRRSVLEEIQRAFDEMAEKVNVNSFNIDALDEAKRKEIILEIHEKVGAGRIDLLLHSIAKGNLKLIGERNRQVPEPETVTEEHLAKLREQQNEVNHGSQKLRELDFSLTMQAMATSMLSWAQSLIDKNLFSKKARIIGLISEGHNKIWPGYGAIAVAKSSLETLSKYMAVEFAGLGIRTNVIQAGITPTPSMEMIPGSDLMKSSAKYRNPYGRLTRPEDIANVVYLLCQPEADWINGSCLIVDGGEHLV